MFFAVDPTVLWRAILAKILFVCPYLVFTVKKLYLDQIFKKLDHIPGVSGQIAYNLYGKFPMAKLKTAINDIAAHRPGK